jgi:hypothetical protein
MFSARSLAHFYSVPGADMTGAAHVALKDRKAAKIVRHMPKYPQNSSHVTTAEG